MDEKKPQIQCGVCLHEGWKLEMTERVQAMESEQAHLAGAVKGQADWQSKFFDDYGHLLKRLLVEQVSREQFRTRVFERVATAGIWAGVAFVAYAVWAAVIEAIAKR